jgi:TetR/AcrR family transcriptional repressor of nem operon
MRLFSSIIFLRKEIEMRKGEQTRERIIAAAAPLFNQHGYAGCSMQDVMDATGLEKGGLYRHFDSKEKLAAESFRFALSQLTKTRTGDLTHIRGSVEKLLYIAQRFLDTPSPIKGGCPLMNTAIDADDGNPLLRKLAAKAIRDWKSRLSKIVEDGKKCGEIHAETEPRRIANTIVAMLEGALMISRIEGTRKPLEDAHQSLKLFLDSLRVSPLVRLGISPTPSCQRELPQARGA